MIDEQSFLTSVENRIDTLLTEVETDIPVSSGNDVLWYVRQYTARRGKRLRPRLLARVAGADGHISDALVDVAAATEILHLFALLHDDRIDRTNRVDVDPERIVSEERHEGLRVLGGDFLYTVGMQLLDHAVAEHSLSPRIVPLVRRVSLITIAGQADDMVYLQHHDKKPGLDRLYTLYDAKTGYYSFVAPLTIGFLLSHRGTDASDSGIAGELARIERLGLLLGRLYQLKDDRGDVLDALESERLGTADVAHWEYNLLGTWLVDGQRFMKPESLVDRNARRAVLETIDTDGFLDWCRLHESELYTEIWQCSRHSPVPADVVKMAGE
ncbi:MAG: polyprenyl synthetase family protein [Spirochaetaceae bacterium]